MKVLEISDNKGYYLIDGQKYDIIDIDKDKIFKLLNIIYECDEELEMDVESGQKKILNQAEKVIYNGILGYFNTFISKKSNIKKEIDGEFSEIKEILEKTDINDNKEE